MLLILSRKRGLILAGARGQQKWSEWCVEGLILVSVCQPNCEGDLEKMDKCSRCRRDREIGGDGEERKVGNWGGGSWGGFNAIIQLLLEEHRGQIKEEKQGGRGSWTFRGKQSTTRNRGKGIKGTVSLLGEVFYYLSDLYET